MTKDLGRDHENLKKLLLSVPGVKDHLESFSVKVGKIVLKRRVDLRLTQLQLVELIQSQGESITQATISKIESGQSVKSDTYDKVFNALELDDLEAHFGRPDKRKQVVLS